MRDDCTKQALGRGAIIVQDAYAQSKMIHHGCWSGHLPRNITPSDVDMTWWLSDRDIEESAAQPCVFDNAGRLLLVEFTSDRRTWETWPANRLGQKRTYAAFARLGCVAVLCQHAVPVGSRVCSLHDVQNFQLMWAGESGMEYSAVLPGADWYPYVADRWFETPAWMRNPAHCRGRITQGMLWGVLLAAAALVEAALVGAMR